MPPATSARLSTTTRTTSADAVVVRNTNTSAVASAEMDRIMGPSCFLEAIRRTAAVGGGPQS